MTSIMNSTGDSTSAAGRPDFGKLAQLGVITLGADGWPVGSAKTPAIGSKEITVRVEGVKMRKSIPVMGGHAVSPDNPIWRAGLNPQKYHEKVIREAELKSVGKIVNIAPELQPAEAEDYLRWLENKGISAPETSVIQNMETAKEEALAKTIIKNKKAASRSKVE